MMRTVTADPTLTGYRSELLVHCYRMLGSVHEAEDLVQETYLRAWRAREDFAGRSSMRTYLYRIATNACLNALRQRTRRVMPAARPLDDNDPHWLEPFPDALLTTDPAQAVLARAGIRLAFVAALQHLPPIRRAVLILRDVLGLSAAETAEILGLTTASVNSALPRARTWMARVAPAADTIGEPADQRHRDLLDRYVAAFERADVPALAELMRADIALEMPPTPAWFHGREAVLGFLAANVLDVPGRFRFAGTRANGQLALASYLGADREAHAIHLPSITGGKIAHLAVFLDPATCALFD
jgi:RNA polymerase sigma-70 factor (ECF subfamily)